MSFAQLFYALMVMAALGVAAHLADQTLIRLHRPTRWVWALAVLLGTALPLAPRPAFLSTAGPPAIREGVGGTSGLTVAGQSSSSNVSLEHGARRLFELSADPRLQPAASLLIACYFGLAWAILSVRRRNWRRLKVDGEVLLVSPTLGPAVIGFFRPQIVFPDWATHLAKDRQRVLIAHEKSHILARDQLLVLGAGICLVLLPWNLVLWWAVARLREAIEIDCDRRVLSAGHPTRTYTECLLHAASAPLNVALVGLSSRSYATLRRRLSVMLVPAPRPSSIRILLSAAATGALLTAACVAKRPVSPTSEPALQGAPELGTPTDAVVRDAIASLYGHQAPVNAGKPAQFWIVLGADGKVQRHDIGRAALIELAKDNPMRERMRGVPGPLYDVDASLKRMYPDLGVGSKAVEIAGGGPVVLGTDTAMVFWAKMAK